MDTISFENGGQRFTASGNDVPVPASSSALSLTALSQQRNKFFSKETNSCFLSVQ